MTTSTIRVHGWIGGEPAYHSEGIDVTDWLDSLDDDGLYAATYLFEKSLAEEYEYRTVRIARSAVTTPIDAAVIVADEGEHLLLKMELNERELATYIRFNRPSVRDRLHLCPCTTFANNGAPCRCDCAFDEPGHTCEACLSGDHEF